jgi:hypothetical protein
MSHSFDFIELHLISLVRCVIHYAVTLAIETCGDLLTRRSGSERQPQGGECHYDLHVDRPFRSEFIEWRLTLGSAQTDGSVFCPDSKARHSLAEKSPAQGAGLDALPRCGRKF